MFKVIVTNPNKTGSPFKASFETQQLAQVWIDSQLAKGDRCGWGKPAHVIPAELDEQGNELVPAQEVAAEFEVDLQDISAQVEQDQVNRAALAYLASTDWLIIREMDEGTPCPVEIKAERAAARARIVG